MRKMKKNKVSRGVSLIMKRLGNIIKFGEDSKVGMKNPDLSFYYRGEDWVLKMSLDELYSNNHSR